MQGAGQRVVGMVEERQRTRQHPSELGLHARAQQTGGEQTGRDQRQPGYVVGAVTVGSAGHGADRVLDDADVVDKGEQVVQPRHGPGAGPVLVVGSVQLVRLAKHLEGVDGDLGPGQTRTDPLRLHPGRGQPHRVIEQIEDCRRHGVGVLEGHEDPGSGAQQVFGVEVGRGHHGAASGHREGQGAGDDLFPGAIGSQVDGSPGQQSSDVLDVGEPVEEPYVIIQVQLRHEPCQTVSVALPVRADHVRMRLTHDQIERVGME